MQKTVRADGSTSTVEVVFGANGRLFANATTLEDFFASECVTVAISGDMESEYMFTIQNSSDGASGTSFVGSGGSETVSVSSTTNSSSANAAGSGDMSVTESVLSEDATTPQAVGGGFTVDVCQGKAMDSLSGTMAYAV